MAVHYDRIYILESAALTIAAESESKPRIETGGVLVGFVDSELNAVVVTAASGPGPQARQQPNAFNRDRAHCQVFLDRHAAATGGVVDFIGEWHKHREPDPWPSPVDVRTYTRLAADTNCHSQLPLVLIAGVVTISRRPRIERYVRTNGFVFRRDGFAAREVQSLPDEAYMDILRVTGHVLFVL